MTGNKYAALCGYVPNPAKVESVINDPFHRHPIFDVGATNVIRTYEKKDTHLWIPLMWLLPDWLRGAQGIGDCFAPDTLVFGPDDTKPIKDVQVGDCVYAGNGMTTLVVSKQVKQSYQPLLTIHTTGGIPLRVTADHKVMAYRFPFREAKTKKRVTKAFHERMEGRGQLATAYENRKAEWVAASELRESDFLLTPISPLVGKRQDHKLLATKGGRWVYGYFLGDGHASGGSVEFAVASEPIAARLCEELAAAGYNPKRGSYRKGCGAFRIRVHSVELVRWFRSNCYGHDGLKVMASWVMADDDAIDGLIDADGYRQDGKIVLDSVSPSLAFGFHSAMLLKGHDATVARVSRSRGSYKNARPMYRVTANTSRQRKRVWRDEAWLCRPVTKIEVSEGPHEVYDIGVAHHSHSFIANGYVAHNCTSWGAAGALTILLAKIFYKLRIKEGFAEVATESEYGLGRVEVNGGRLGGYSDGCSGAALADAVSKFGCVLRKDYSGETGNPEHDMRKYDKNKAKEWGNFGCGGRNDKGALDKIARLQICKTVSRVGGFEDVAAAIAGSLCPVTNASMYGTDMKRDKYGQCKWNGSWSHMQFWLAVRFGKYPAVLKMQSWGPNVVSGPMGDEFTENLPEGGTPKAIQGCCWWQPAEDVDKECRGGDCWAYGDLPDWELDKTDFTQVFGATKPRSSGRKTTVAI